MYFITFRVLDKSKVVMNMSRVNEKFGLLDFLGRCFKFITSSNDLIRLNIDNFPAPDVVINQSP